MLPGGHAVIFTISKGANLWDNTQIVVRSLSTGDQTVLIEGGADGRYVPTGHIVYARLGTLMAVPFDPVRLVLTGGATGLIDGVMQAADFNLSDMENTLASQFTVSDTGALIYVTGGVLPAIQRSLAWVDRKGTSQPLSAPPRAYRTPRLSPDGRHVAAFIPGEASVRCGATTSLAVRSAPSPLTGSALTVFLRQTRNGSSFRSGAAGAEDNLYWKAADGSGSAERLTTSTRNQTPTSWSPDGTALAFVEEGDSLVRPRFSSSMSGCCQSAIARRVRSSKRLQTRCHPSFPRTGAGWRTSRTNPDATRSTCSHIPGPGSVI